jgi:Icc-related predicted phosphoesterase
MRIFYASDIHGSEGCWRKFLNAATFYRAEILIMGGDIVGKAICPIEVTNGSTGKAVVLGRSHSFTTASELEAFERHVRDSGFYPYRARPEELKDLDHSDEKREALFEKVVRSDLQRWIAIADEKLAKTDATVYVMGGNDDPWFIDEDLKNAKSFVFCDQRVVQFDGIEMLSVSYSNRTPWRSPREVEEDELYATIRDLAERVRDPETALYNLHVPPYKSGLDEAPRVNDRLELVTHMGQVEMLAVGSVGVRRAIEEFQPLAGLHGHIHESPGISSIGRTVIINPGSDYTSGNIHGALLEIHKGRLKTRQLVTG